MEACYSIGLVMAFMCWELGSIVFLGLVEESIGIVLNALDACCYCVANKFRIEGETHHFGMCAIFIYLYCC